MDRDYGRWSSSNDCRYREDFVDPSFRGGSLRGGADPPAPTSWREAPPQHQQQLRGAVSAERQRNWQNEAAAASSRRGQQLPPGGGYQPAPGGKYDYDDPNQRYSIADMMGNGGGGPPEPPNNSAASSLASKPWVTKVIPDDLKEELMIAARSRLRRVGISMKDMELPPMGRDVGHGGDYGDSGREDFEPQLYDRRPPGMQHSSVGNVREATPLHHRPTSHSGRYSADRNPGFLNDPRHPNVAGTVRHSASSPNQVISHHAPPPPPPPPPPPQPMLARPATYPNLAGTQDQQRSNAQMDMDYPHGMGYPRNNYQNEMEVRRSNEILHRQQQQQQLDMSHSSRRTGGPRQHDQYSNNMTPQHHGPADLGLGGADPSGGPHHRRSGYPVRDLTPRIPVPQPEPPPPRNWTPAPRPPTAATATPGQRPVPAPRRNREPASLGGSGYAPPGAVAPQQPAGRGSGVVGSNSGTNRASLSSGFSPQPPQLQQQRFYSDSSQNSGGSGRNFDGATPGGGYWSQDPRQLQRHPDPFQHQGLTSSSSSTSSSSAARRPTAAPQHGGDYDPYGNRQHPFQQPQHGQLVTGPGDEYFSMADGIDEGQQEAYYGIRPQSSRVKADFHQVLEKFTGGQMLRPGAGGGQGSSSSY